MSVGLVAVLVGLLAFTVVYAIAAPVGELPEHDLEGEDYGITPVDPTAGGIFEKVIRPVLRNFLPQTPLSAQLKARNSQKVRELLVRSGNPWNIQPEEYFGLQVLAGCFGFIVGLVLAVMGVLPTMLPIYGWMLVGAALGAYMPKVMLDNAKKNRLKEARRGLPEALDLLVITLNAGMNFSPALAEVVTRLPGGVIRNELGRVSADLRAGKTLDRALTDFARRAPSDEVESFAKAVLVSERLGSDVSDTLRSQSESARAAYEAGLDIKIGKLPTTLFVPILVLMLPALFIVILAPAFSNIAHSF